MNKFVILSVLITTVLANNIDKNAQIISQVNEQDPNTLAYNWNYQTSNGIWNGETGEPGKYTKGYSQWIGQDGIQYLMTYIADHNGFRVEGSHLPTPPPTPDYILKSLEEIRVAHLKKRET